jgi:hypothetical protein
LGAFAGSDENVVVGGDFAVTENELRTALKSLREAGIAAIHSHMTGEEPRIIFFNYWGRGPAQRLAQSIQKALPAGTEIPAKPRPQCEMRASASVTRRARQCNHFTPSRLNPLFDILPSFPLVNGSDKLTNFLYLMTEDACPASFIERL